MNEADSAVVAELLEEKGYSLAPTPHTADIVVVNTCTVRGMAEHKARSFIGKLEDLKKVWPGAISYSSRNIAEGKKIKFRFVK
jgi:tRNA-2-methylthio-N6-dimethylallyladenosine synthase